MTIDVLPKHQFSYEGTSIRVYIANKGEGIPKHTHNYSHAVACTAGRCAIRKENVYVEMDVLTQPINLVGQEWHEIEALEDKTSFITVFKEGKY
jgi:quercetin dioxygenase-like cupin family protein